MDDLLATLLSFPPHPAPPIPLSDQYYDAGIRAQIDSIRKIPVKYLLQTTSSGDSILSVIDPYLNTIPYAIILVAYINNFQTHGRSTAMGAEDLWQRIMTFLQQSDRRQIRYVGHEFVQIIVATVNLGRRVQKLDIAVTPIAQAILRVDESGSTFTSTHLLFVRLAVETRAYSQATEILDRSILHFPGTSHQSKLKYICASDLPAPNYITVDSGFTAKLNYQDVLEYFLLSGTVYIGLNQWKKALNSLESAIAYPVKEGAVSKIMVDAYKKWTLVNLLVKGKAGSLPGTTDSTAAKFYHILAKPYDIVASLFESASAPRLLAEVDVGHNIWMDDANLGLVLFVLAAYQKFQIRNLAKIYHKISISKITKMTVSAETGKSLPTNQATENLIAQMIADGELHATISHAGEDQATLTFTSATSVLSETDVQIQLTDSLTRIKSMTDSIKATDRRLTYEKEYLRWTLKQKKLDRSGIGDGISMEDMVWNAADEDLMSSGL